MSSMSSTRQIWCHALHSFESRIVHISTLHACVPIFSLVSQYGESSLRLPKDVYFAASVLDASGLEWLCGTPE